MQPSSLPHLVNDIGSVVSSHGQTLLNTPLNLQGVQQTAATHVQDTSVSEWDDNTAILLRSKQRYRFDMSTYIL